MEEGSGELAGKLEKQGGDNQAKRGKDDSQMDYVKYVHYCILRPSRPTWEGRNVKGDCKFAV